MPILEVAEFPNKVSPLLSDLKDPYRQDPLGLVVGTRYSRLLFGGSLMLRKFVLGALAVTGAVAFASSAMASTLMVSDVGVTGINTVTVPGHGGENSTGIIFNGTQLVFCADLEHNIGVTHYSPPLTFTWGVLEFNGAGDPLDDVTSNRIGHLADIGRHVYYSGDSDIAADLSAIQGAIWSLEYTNPYVSGLRATSADAEIDGEIVHYLALAHLFNGHERARALLAHGQFGGGVQNMVGGGVPEPASWALMIGGLGLTGAALRRRRQAAVTA